MKNKNLKLAMIALLGTAAVSAQDMKVDDVPSDLRNTFEQAHPDAKDVEWEKEGDSYKVEFEINREDHEIWYTADGNTSKTEKEISESDLPQAIKSVISNNYADYKIDSIEMTEEGGSASYVVELEKGWNDEKNIVFAADGKIVSEIDD